MRNHIPEESGKPTPFMGGYVTYSLVIIGISDSFIY